MTISDITIGTAATAVNASVTPGTPSGLQEGDLMIIFAAIRNVGAGTPNTPSGWLRLYSPSVNLNLFGRFYQAGDTMPAVTFTGGVANADTYARCLKMRGVAKDALTELSASYQANASAANIAYPALDMPDDNHAAIMAVWKQDDATSLTTPAGWTAQGLTNMTTGDDMLAAIFTQIQTTETDISAGSVTVTGGASAVSGALMWAVRPAPTLTVTEFDLFPPTTAVTVNGLLAGDNVVLYRVTADGRTALRGGELTGATDPAFLVVDGELPFDEPVAYLAVVNGSAEYQSAFVTYDLPGGKAVLSDAVTGQASECVIVSWPEKAYNRQASVFKVGGRNVVVVGEVGMFEGTIEVFFEAYSSTENFFDLLSSATEGVLQLRRPSAAYDGIDCYLSVIGARERRYSQDGTDGRRVWALDVAETEAWSAAQVAQAYTWQDVIDFYASGSGTWATLASDHATWLAVLQADFQ